MESLRDSTRSTSISVASVFMRHVYQWMTVGLLVTAGTAFFVASSPALLSAIFGNTFGLIILAIAVFAMPLVLSGMISRLSALAATTLFVVYSALMGAFLSSVLLVYTGASVMSTFVTCAASREIMPLRTSGMANTAMARMIRPKVLPKMADRRAGEDATKKAVPAVTSRPTVIHRHQT